MLKVYAFLTKREDLDTQAFIDYYENHHVPLALSLAAAPKIYKRNYVDRDDELTRDHPAVDFDVITELVFEDRGGFLDWVASLGVAEIAEDEARFLDRSRTRAYVIDERTSSA
jgi:uncharacterized protein (TIGR02118 family)